MSYRAEDQPLSGVAAWYFGAAERWPEVFDPGLLGSFWYQADSLAEDQTQFVQALRASLLRVTQQKCSGCTRCSLHQHRYGTAVLDDGSLLNDLLKPEGSSPVPVGATSAKIMLIGEGPGQYEQRTGIPFVSYQVLSGSRCASLCTNYETCYPGTSLPKAPCKPASLRRALSQKHEEGEVEEQLLQIQQERARAKPFYIHTAGNILDRVLLAAGLWRESWNPRIERADEASRKMEPQPGSVYITNIVRCRSAVPDDSVDGLRDQAPETENVAQCNYWLEMQYYIVQPLVVMPMGNPAVQNVLQIKNPRITHLRGTLHQWRDGLAAIPEIHPCYVLRKMREVGGRVVHSEDSEKLMAEMVQSFELAKGVVEGTTTPPWKEARPPQGPAIEQAEFLPTFPEQLADEPE